MKKGLIGLVSCLMIGLVTGCSSNKTTTSATSETTTATTNEEKQTDYKYKSAIDNGKKAIVDKDMSKAIAAFQLALEYKKDSAEAQQMVEQVKLYQTIVSLKEKKEHAKALKELSELVSSKDGAAGLKQYGKELMDEITQEVMKENEENKKALEKKEEQTPPKKETTAPPTETTTNTLWNAQKKSELRSFMQSWGNIMGQSYIEYYPGFEANWYGYSFPSELANNNIAVGGNRATVQWSDTGESSSGYNVVAVYSDITTTQKLERHLYLFTILNGQPVVLVTMQNQGNNENLIYFKQTQNADLSNGFSAIVGS
ncbi:DUF4767 domain-containing protein [Candidatus Enterococcus mansonii]|uniref:DUF4767 domain-containing protein n=1 Tax=Candidatus Enterococcus mansonii TaxID=1834181 RepID=A0A242CCS6_9ENTE|nr:DUF4767 domain-containing protein [Enterococcus sp. 4G2_DIV0659]OTO07996.1 hypothetical protein A5880_002266 [Enterococcus sp. 4G2_DIV0659]